MISLSNNDYQELLACLQERIDQYTECGSLREYNKHRRRKMLLRKLSRRKAIGKLCSHTTNTTDDEG